MPSYKVHLIGGAIVALVALQAPIFYTCDFFYKIELFFCAMLGSLFPDIDTKSKGQKIFYWIITITVIGAVLHNNVSYAVSLAIPTFIPLLVNHRGIMHSFSILMLVAGLLSIAIQSLFPFNQAIHLQIKLCFFVMGVVSHLWLDRGFKRMIRS